MSKKDKNKQKKPYVKPKIKSEELMVFGALCNGSPASGGRKAAGGPPDFCNPSKLLS